MNKSKQVGDYSFGGIIADYGDGITIVHANKHQKQVSIYCLPLKEIQHKDLFLQFKADLSNNPLSIYPHYIQTLLTSNNAYIVIQDVIKPSLTSKNEKQIMVTLNGLQAIYKTPYKLEKHHIFMKNQASKQVCFMPKFSPGKATSALYSKYANKSILVELFIELSHPQNEFDCKKIMVDHMDDPKLFDMIKHYVFPKKSTIINKQKSMTSQQGNQKQSYVQILGESATEYPDVDELEFEQLTKFAHVNNGLKEQAGKAFMRTSNRASYQDRESSEHYNQIFEEVKQSVYNNTKTKMKVKESKAQIKIEASKLKGDQFDTYFGHYIKIFSLFDLTFKSYLQRYPKGFSGAIAGYLLTVVGLLKALRFYKDLMNRVDIFDIGEEAYYKDYDPYLQQIRPVLARHSQKLIRLKQLIDTMEIPYKTYEILAPYLQDNIQMIDLKLTQDYCFFFMGKLIQKGNHYSMHEILVLQTMEVLGTEEYQIVFFEEQMPQKWDKGFYDTLKNQICILHPSLKIK